MTSSPSEMYLRTKEAISELVMEENQNTQVPACPNWTLRDLLGHLVGSIEDIRNGNMDGFPTDAWTAPQVERYAHLDLAGVKQAWTDVLERMGDGFASAAQLDLPDIAVHEFDVRGAVGDTNNRDSESLAAAESFFAENLCNAFQAKGVPPLRLVYTDSSFVIGGEEAQAELRTSPFELSRVATGRRSEDQVRAMDCSVDPEPWIQHISLFPPRKTDLLE